MKDFGIKQQPACGVQTPVLHIQFTLIEFGWMKWWLKPYFSSSFEPFTALKGQEKQAKGRAEQSPWCLTAAAAGVGGQIAVFCSAHGSSCAETLLGVTDERSRWGVFL